jgi:hypothetical protein
VCAFTGHTHLLELELVDQEVADELDRLVEGKPGGREREGGSEEKEEEWCSERIRGGVVFREEQE